jgi:hypothetical protein
VTEDPQANEEQAGPEEHTPLGAEHETLQSPGDETPGTAEQPADQPDDQPQPQPDQPEADPGDATE